MWGLTNEDFTGLMRQYQKLIYTVRLQFVPDPHTAEVVSYTHLTADCPFSRAVRWFSSTSPFFIICSKFVHIFAVDCTCSVSYTHLQYATPCPGSRPCICSESIVPLQIPASRVQRAENILVHNKNYIAMIAQPL